MASVGGDRVIAMRHASLLHALAKAGLFTGLFLGSGLISIAYAANADGGRNN